MKRTMLGLAAAIFVTGAALGSAFAAQPETKYGDSSLGKVLTDSKGMTLYIFDNDKGQAVSSCTGKCIAAWPPFVAPAAQPTADGDWTATPIKDKDGKDTFIWVYEGMPLYYFVKDKAAGDVAGDGVGTVWHVVKQAM